MNKQEYEAKRDELIENKSQFCQCNGIVCHGCESIIRKNLSIGFDFAWNLAQAEIEELKKKHEDFCEQAQEKTDEDFSALLREIEELKRDASELISALKHTWPGEYGQIIMEFNKQFLDQWNSKHGGGK